MLGKMQYGSALFWLRGSTDSIEETRYYYCMGMAACMGLETTEVTGLMCASKCRVTSGHNGYLKACKFLDLPTLEDVAIANARVIIRQWSHWDPAVFAYDPNYPNLKKIIGIADEITENALLPDLVDLANKRRNSWWPAFYQVKYNMERRFLFLQDEDNWEHIPSYRIYFRKAKVKSTEIWAETDKPPSPLDVINTYKYMCRHHFNCIELGVRRKKRLGLVGMLGYNTQMKTSDSKKRKTSRERTKKAKKRRITTFTCSTPVPNICGRRERACRLCGYSIPKKCKNFVTLGCCMKLMHEICWNNSSEKYRSEKGAIVSPHCNMLSFYTKKGGEKRPEDEYVPSASEPVASPPRSVIGSANRTQSQPVADIDNGIEKAPCPFCGKLLSLNDNRHAMYECTKLNELFDPGGDIEPGAHNTLTPLALRCAAMSRVDSMEGTPLALRMPPRR